MTEVTATVSNDFTKLTEILTKQMTSFCKFEEAVLAFLQGICLGEIPGFVTRQRHTLALLLRGSSNVELTRNINSLSSLTPVSKPPANGFTTCILPLFVREYTEVLFATFMVASTAVIRPV